MAAQPIQLYGANGRPVSSNNLIEAARPNLIDRPRIPRVDRDFNTNLSNWGWRELLAAGRFLFSNCPPLQKAMRDQASIAIRNAFIPQYYGRNKSWGERAEELLYEWHKIHDVRGGMFDFSTNLKLWTKSIRRDGDVAILLTESSTGYPLTQTIPAHRIGGWNSQNGVVESGPYAGYQIYNGVISDRYGRAIALRVFSPDGESFQDVSAVTIIDADGTIKQTADIHLFYDPDYCDQGRGLTRVASGIFDWGDLRQVKDFLKLALKKEASFAVVEYNETGTFDTADDFRADTRGDSNAASAYFERTEGGLTQIYKAGTGSKIEFPSGQRPAAVTQEFWQKITRDAFAAIDWPMEFYDSLTKGGAALRLIMEVTQPSIEDIQALAKKIAVKIDMWRLAKAIQLGELDPDPDWWMIEHQTPQEMTADKGYSAQIDREDYKLGFTSLKRVSGRRGQWWQDLRIEQDEEIDDLLERAQKRAQKFGITLEAAINLYRQPSANPPANMTQPAADPNEDPKQNQDE